MSVIDLQLSGALPSASGGAGAYVDWWVVHLSVANLLVIVLMVLTFIAALLLPFPAAEEEPVPGPVAAQEPEADR
jgi:hypothetical protein